MSATNLAGVRFVPYAATTFTAFRLCPALNGPDRISPLGEIDAGTIDEALSKTLAGDRASSSGIFHKDHLAIRETDEAGTRVHLYAIKRKSAPRYEYRNYVTRPVHDLYAMKACVIPGEVFVDAAFGEEVR